MSSWKVTEEIREKYNPVILEFLDQIETISFNDSFGIDLSNEQINPFTLKLLLEEIGYELTDQSSNGWQMDFWLTMEKDRYRTLCISGTGITFTLKLSTN